MIFFNANKWYDGAEVNTMSENLYEHMNLVDIYIAIISNMQDGAYFVDKNRKILFWNKSAERITGYSKEEIIGKDCPKSNLNHIDEEGHPLCQVGCPLFATNIDGKQRQERVFVRHKDGHRVPLRVNIFPIRDNEGNIQGSIELFTQDSPTKYDDSLITKLSGAAMHDDLTKLPNRRYLESFLSYKLSQFKHFGQKFAVVFADIDDFSVFNNTYGHEAGDLVLHNIASSIKKVIQKEDLFGRWGGEEFVGIYTIHNDYETTIIAEKLRSLVENTEINYNGENLHVSISVGATKVLMNDTTETIVDRADRLMYTSKTSGKNKVTVD